MYAAFEPQALIYIHVFTIPKRVGRNKNATVKMQDLLTHSQLASRFWRHFFSSHVIVHIQTHPSTSHCLF